MTAQPNRRRSALAEIPVRMSQLRVSTDDMPIVLSRTVIDSPLDNIPIGYLTPSPSQDELIIRQRGRRRISINWSPEKTPSTSTSASSSSTSLLSITRTPTKSTTTMTLRSSPRKRLHLPDGIQSTSSAAHILSPRKLNRGPSSLATPNTVYTPQAKRSRLTESPMAQRNTKTPLAKVLKGLSQAQLINVIQELVNNEPEIETKIRANLPMPDIKPMEEQLVQLKKNIFKSLPQSRLVKNTDSVAYSRSSTHLATFKKTVVDQSRQLSDSENWDALVDYSLMAWSYVRATPTWDNTSHNAVRRSCFKILSWHCLCALKSAGIGLGEPRLNELMANVAMMQTDCDDIGSCVPYLERLLGKIGDNSFDDVAATASITIA